MKKRTKVQKIKIDVWRASIYVRYVFDSEEYMLDGDEPDGYTVIDHKYSPTIVLPMYCIRNNSTVSMSTIVHEATHAALDILDRVGTSAVDRPENEQLTYLLGYIINRIMLYMKKHNLKYTQA